MAKKKAPTPSSTSPKPARLQAEIHQNAVENGVHLTTNQGLPISDNQNSLKAGVRGRVLLEDFIPREKITHFDHERIPERVVHARGSGAHGYFQPYESAADITMAGFFRILAKRPKSSSVFHRRGRCRIPVNAPRCPVRNFQRDGLRQMDVPKGRVAYEPNSLAPEAPRECPMHGFKTLSEEVTGEKIRQRSETFADHYSQARMFFRSMTQTEQNHIASALAFEFPASNSKASGGGCWAIYC